MFEFLRSRLRPHEVKVGFCTLAIRAPYRSRARLLLADATEAPWVVLTDEPGDFEGLEARVICHAPIGPMAEEFLTWKGNGMGRPAYHDKRFALQATLKEFETAIFVDADSRMNGVPKLPIFPPGVAAVKEVYASITEHLSRWGSHRLPAFEELALQLTGSKETLESARWCSEALFAITKDGNESKFFDAWDYSAEFLHRKNLFSGEGGVIGLAAVCAGWKVNYNTLSKLAAVTHHEGLGPKSS